MDTAEYLYVLLQSKDLGIDTEDVEEVLLETEWCVPHLLVFFLCRSTNSSWCTRASEDGSALQTKAERCAQLLAVSHDT